MNTFIFVFSTTFFEILFGLGMALIINRSFRGRGLVRAAVLIPWAIPTVVSSQMWRFIYNDKYGLLNYLLFGTAESKYRAWLADPLFAFIGVIVADIWKASSFAALLILAGLQTIPDDLYEAARIDGADAWQRFRSITAPLVKPAILIALLFRTMDGFRVFDLIFVMTQGGPADSTNVLQFYGYKKIFAEGLMGYGSAVSVVVFLITLATAVVYIKFVGTRLFRERT
jgi:multiple sugar transport system permease protein